MASNSTAQSRESPNRELIARPLSLRIYPDSVLRQVCKPVERSDRWLTDVLDEMLVLMRASNGIGLAGPQVGITQRLLVSEINGQTICLVNPVITSRTGQAEMVEGCLTLPGIQVNVGRNQEIKVRGYDSQGRKQKHRLRGLWARVIQHEIDHLGGILICDRGDPMPGSAASSGTR